MNNIKVLDGQILYADSNDYVLFIKNKIVFENQSNNFHKSLILPCNLLVSNIKLLRRLFRYDIRCFSKLVDKYFFFFKGTLFVIDNNFKLRPLKHFGNMSSPLYFYTDENKRFIFFGDYSNNKTKEPVNIYKLDYDEKITTIFTFKKSEIKHIHNIQYYDKSYYISTGDNDKESGIWIIDGNGIKPVCVGSQRFRTCFLFKNEEAIVYLTDSPFSQNYILSLDLRTNTVSEVCQINGPCIHATTNNDFLFFSTSVEPDPTKRVPFNNFFVSKSIKDRYIHIFKYDFSNNETVELYKFKKDLHNMRLFGLGNARLLISKNSLLVIPYGNNKLYGKTIIIDIK